MRRIRRVYNGDHPLAASQERRGPRTGTSNVQTVQEIYAAFGRGDVPAILAHLADDVDWEWGRADIGVPWLQPRRGREAVGGFFESLAALEITKFRPTHFMQSDDGSIVIALIDLDGKVKATGKPIADAEEVHVWHFGPDGKVTRFRHGVDTHAHYLAQKGS